MVTPDAFLLALLAPLALAGLSLINTGLSRSRSASHVITGSLCAAAVAMLVYCLFGFAFAGFNGARGHTLVVGGRYWDWLGTGPFFLSGFDFGDLRASGILVLQVFSVALAALIPVGTLAERWRLAAACISTALVAGWVYPLFSHWIWSGWLAHLGFLDPGGASAIQAVGGLAALSIAWIAGPRRGKFSSDGIPAAMPGHNAVIVLFGCMLALPGWLGLNLAGAALFSGAGPESLVLAAINTALSASAAAFTCLVTTRIRFGRPDASLIANGWIGGLVASGAVALFIAPPVAIVVGAIAGFLIVLSVETIELRLRIDDPSGGISVHAVTGLWSCLAAGIWAHRPAEMPARIGQFAAQLAGIATLIGCIFPLLYSVNWILDRLLPHRIESEGEQQGIDLFELGAGAYPEFVTHREDLLRRPLE
jgi:Amt family ammonium transporter